MDDPTNPVYKDQRHGKSRELLYSYDENGKFKKTVGFHGEPDRVILQQAWDVFNDRIENARQKVIIVKVSPIVDYIEKNLMDPLSLSILTGISIWRVKLHFKPFMFKRLNRKILQKYADAFNIGVNKLTKVE
ncbi:MAG: hypothetical protein PHF97_05595 [Bacteroidales bacterium]|nr:hypothetical protein [Bacteroidales bacterium]